MISEAEVARVAREYLEGAGWAWNEPVSVALAGLEERGAFQVKTGPLRIEGRVVVGGGVSVFVDAEGGLILRGVLPVRSVRYWDCEWRGYTDLY